MPASPEPVAFEVKLGSHYSPITETESVTASYYVHEDGRTTFKDTSHRAIADYPTNSVRSIRTSSPK